MSKLQDIRELAQEHATSVSSSPRDWMGYMDTAARLYRYSFTDQLLIHAQHPQATACASLELWNEKMFRWVNRGARGIALLDENGHNTRLRYVFDMSDTHMVAGGRSPYLWQMQEHQQDEILTHLAEAYGLEEKDTGTLSDALMAVAREMVAPVSDPHHHPGVCPCSEPSGSLHGPLHPDGPHRPSGQNGPVSRSPDPEYLHGLLPP